MKKLLPGDWDHRIFKYGLNPIDPSEFEGRLYKSSEIESRGVPSIFAHSYSFTKALSTTIPDPKALEQFSLLIRALFLGIINVKLIDVKGLDNFGGVLQSFEPDIRHYYVLKWKDKAIGGIYPDCFVFPGAKFLIVSSYKGADDRHPEPDYKKITKDNLEQEIEKTTKLYGPDLVKSLFASWVDGINNLKVNGLNVFNTSNLPLWLKMLNHVKTEDWHTDLKAPPDSLEKFTSNFVDVKFVQLRHRGNSVEIPLRKISKMIFCEKIIQFDDGKIPDIPVKGEYLNLVDIPNTSYERDDNKIRYSIQLKNWPAPIHWSPLEIIKGDKASILLWPNFKDDYWHVNYVLFFASEVFIGKNPNLKLMNSNCEPIGDALSPAEGCRTDDSVEYIEILTENNSMGIFKDEREEIVARPGHMAISLDFGTSHTCIGVKDENGKYQLFQFKDMTYDVLDMGYFYSDASYAQELKKGGFWFPPASFKDELSIIPTELVFASQKRLKEGTVSLERPIKNFSIPHPRIERGKLHQCILANFKWPWKVPKEEFDRIEVIKSYLRILLHMALAVIRKDDLCNNVSILPTYPLAFGRQMYDEYKKILTDLFEKIQTETGTNLNLAVVNTEGLQELVGESYAAKAFWQPVEGTAELVVDIGGGTTDIALIVNENEFVDSFQYGANRYLEKLARQFASHPSGISDERERAIALQKEIRGNGILGLLKIYPGKQKDSAQQIIDRFFQGLLEYLRRLLTGTKAQRVHLYPVGNGWRLIEGFEPPNDKISDYVKNWFKGSGIEIDITLSKDFDDYKGLVCKGAMNIADDGWYVHPDLRTPVNTIVGGKIRVKGREIDENDTVPTSPLGRPPLKFDTSLFIESLPFTPSNRSNITEICEKLNSFCIRETYSCPGGTKGMKKSVYVIFLENIYPEYYL